nr:hypothetical protein [Microctonus hyperodae filamentous virus]
MESSTGEITAALQLIIPPPSPISPTYCEKYLETTINLEDIAWEETITTTSMPHQNSIFIEEAREFIQDFSNFVSSPLPDPLLPSPPQQQQQQSLEIVTTTTTIEEILDKMEKDKLFNVYHPILGYQVPMEFTKRHRPINEMCKNISLCEYQSAFELDVKFLVHTKCIVENSFCKNTITIDRLLLLDTLGISMLYLYTKSSVSSIGAFCLNSINPPKQKKVESMFILIPAQCSLVLFSRKRKTVCFEIAASHLGTFHIKIKKNKYFLFQNNEQQIIKLDILGIFAQIEINYYLYHTSEFKPKEQNNIDKIATVYSLAHECFFTENLSKEIFFSYTCLKNEINLLIYYNLIRHVFYHFSYITIESSLKLLQKCNFTKYYLDNIIVNINEKYKYYMIDG